ncbi:XYLOGLUCAN GALACTOSYLTRANSFERASE XLT2 [Salix purpurea]|uniref:XYLOGLUCAN GALACTOSYLTRANSFERASE XLT2 n=1 Tax=Salix purpurea TaxID=77065 RepID=A0A9Q0VFW4_SALPP|nr:XYLOGLUCAN GALACTOSYLTRANSFERASE XLT2 [Salix purpurea]
MMFPLSNPSSAPEPQIKKPKTTLDFRRKDSFKSPKAFLAAHHPSCNQILLCLFLSIFSIQILFVVVFRSIPPPSHHRSHHFPAPVTSHHHLTPTLTTTTAPISASTVKGETSCESGKIFVYDLPSPLNHELVSHCDVLNPWSSSCAALTNDGFGPVAAGIPSAVPENLAAAWYWTDQFVTEILFHNRILNHKCRTKDPNNATAFYIPFYVGLAVGKFLWLKNSSAKERDFHCEMMLKWVQDQPYFTRNDGWDHFLTMGRISWDFRRSKDEDWGSSCIHKPGMRNITRLLIERNPWDYFDVGVPYPTGFHPRSDNDVVQWQDFVRNRSRKSLFCFAGAKRSKIKNDFRGLLLSHCKNESDSCRVVDCAGSKCSNGTSIILETFLDSVFCLQPRGDSFTRRSIFDCMIAGSIPVLFWKRSAYDQYEWFLPAEPESYSVFIDRNAVKNGTTSVRKVLERYGEDEIRRMRERVIEYIPKFLYARPDEGLQTIKDAFDVAIDGVLGRFKEQEQPGYRW